MKYKLIVLSFLILSFLSCNQSTEPELPEWINSLIKQFEDQPVGNPPQSIWKYTYQSQTVYYVPAQCCDQLSILYNDQGEIICAPDGGFFGKGDGKCPDFFEERKNEKLIWRDIQMD